MKIRFCDHNKGKGKVFRALSEENPDLNIKIKKCIKQCGVCRDTPVATVDNVRVVGKDGDALYLALVAAIKGSEATHE